MNMASSLMNNPQVQQLMSGMMSGAYGGMPAAAGGGAGGMGADVGGSGAGLGGLGGLGDSGQPGRTLGAAWHRGRLQLLEPEIYQDSSR
ncbi:alanine and glycine-rich protein, partial [Etheostoma spectabile]|uniref:alanine and glycine-rich protein n=1 Tax=Etheostoma spectabile TaxID=54343 RepID=UPI0013AEF27C